MTTSPTPAALGARRRGTTVVTVDLGELGSQRFRVAWAGADTTVCWVPDDPAELVFHALSSKPTACDEAGAVLQALLRDGVGLEEATEWAQLDIKPWRPHWMYVWKVPDRPTDLHHVDKWREAGFTPRHVNDEGSCGRRGIRASLPHRVIE